MANRPVDLRRRFHAPVSHRKQRRPPQGQIYWRCLCLCGNERVTTADKLREGKVKSCGCIRRDRTRNTSTATVPALVTL